MAGQIINNEQLNNLVTTSFPNLVKESGCKVERFLDNLANRTSRVAFWLGGIAPFRMTSNQNPEFPFSDGLTDQERTKLTADLKGISSGRTL